jgi:hypothetical protein
MNMGDLGGNQSLACSMETDIPDGENSVAINFNLHQSKATNQRIGSLSMNCIRCRA